MRNSLIRITPLLVVSFLLTVPTLSKAQALRTWVSGVGDDANQCSRTAPCKTFAGALLKTTTGGEIDCLTSGGFGAVTISKSVMIDGTGCQASILSGGVTAITINISSTADAAKTVRLRHLSINGVGTGKTGISVVQARRLFVNDVLIDGFGDHGIRVETGQAEIFVADTTIRNVGKSGINIVPTGTGSSIRLFVEKTSVTEAFTAVSVSKAARATIRDSSFFQNRNGLIAQTSEVNVINCVYTENETAITSSDDGLVRLSDVAVINNGKGLRISGGKILAFNHVLINGNENDGAPSATIPTP